MAVLRLDHVNIRTARLAESIAFYGDLLGLAMRPSPGQTDLSLGAYGYDEDGHAVLHLVQAEGEADGPPPLPRYGKARRGVIDHFSFRYGPGDPVRERIERSGVEHSWVEVPILGVRLCFLRDPNDITVELGFPLEDAARA